MFKPNEKEAIQYYVIDKNTFIPQTIAIATDDELPTRINPDEISVDLKKIEDEMNVLKRSNGGLSIEQTAGALKIFLWDKEDVYVVYNKEVCGIAELDNPLIAEDINNITHNPTWIMLPYAINHEHQISIVINTRKSQVIVTDSLGIDRTSSENIKQLATLIKCKTITKGISNYQNKAGAWECGIHTIYNSLDIVHKVRKKPKSKLELDNHLRDALIAATRYSLIEGEVQKQRDNNRLEKCRLLEAIQSFRDEKGYFKNNAQDDLKFLADALQVELYENTNRVMPTSHTDRVMKQKEVIRDREIEQLVEEYEKEHKNDLLGIILLNVLKRGGKYEEVIDFCRRALEADDLVFVDNTQDEDEDVGLFNLGSIFLILCKYRKAQECYEIVLSSTTASKKLKADSIRALGNVHTCMENIQLAYSYQLRAIVAYRKTFGEAHPDIAMCLNNLGLSYSYLYIFSTNLGHIKKAIQYYHEAINMYKETLGEEHRWIALSLHNIGIAFYRIGNLAKASSYFQQSIAMKEKILGRKHSSIWTPLNYLGKIYKAMGNFIQARKCYERTLEIEDKTPNKDFSLRAETLSNLGMLCTDLNEFEEAIDCYQQAWDVSVKLLGPEHPETADILLYFAITYCEQKKYPEAIQSLNKYLDIIRTRPNVNLDLVQLIENKIEEVNALYKQELSISSSSKEIT